MSDISDIKMAKSEEHLKESVVWYWLKRKYNNDINSSCCGHFHDKNATKYRNRTYLYLQIYPKSQKQSITEVMSTTLFIEKLQLIVS